MITRQEVAERAGVSPATVSNVINGSKFVSPDLAAKVERAIADLNYIPNRAARSLASRRTEQVGILVPSLSNPYYGNVAEGMEEVARKNGYIVSIITAEGPMDRYISHIIERQMDGVFLTDFIFDFTGEQLSRMRKNGVQFVLAVGSSYGEEKAAIEPFPRISINYRTAVGRMFELLYRLGHRRVVFLSGNDTSLWEARKSEYIRCVKEYGFESDPDLIVGGEYPYVTLPEDGYRDMKGLLSRRRDFTAVFALNDLMALGAMKALREAGLSVPGDVSVIGCDDIYLSETACPPLSTISIPKREIGRAAMELLLEMLRGGEYRSVVEVEPEFMDRESISRARF